MAVSNPSELEEDYHSALKDLVNPSRPLITMLTMLAEESIDNAAGIVRVINEWCSMTQHKLCVMFLVDSIMKNVGKNYIRAFSNIIVAMFTHVFKSVDERTRRKLFELRLTWNDVLPSSRLYFLDAKINEMDPAWPLSVATPELKATPVSSGSNIYLNPNKFMVVTSSGDQIVTPTASSDVEAVRKVQIDKRRLDAPSASSDMEELRKIQIEKRKLDEKKKKVVMMMKLEANKAENVSPQSIVPPVPLPTTSNKQAEVQSHRGTKKKVSKGRDTDDVLPPANQSKKMENIKPNIYVSPTRAKDLIPIIAAQHGNGSDIRSSLHPHVAASKPLDSSPGRPFPSPRDPRLLAKEKTDDVKHKEKEKVVFRELPRSQDRRIKERTDHQSRSRSKEKSESSSRDPRVNKPDGRRSSTPKEEHRRDENKSSSSGGSKSSVSNRDPRIKNSGLTTVNLFKSTDSTEDPLKDKHKDTSPKVRYRERHDNKQMFKGVRATSTERRDKALDIEIKTEKLKYPTNTKDPRCDIQIMAKGTSKIDDGINRDKEKNYKEKEISNKEKSIPKIRESMSKEKVKSKEAYPKESEKITKVKESVETERERNLSKEREREQKRQRAMKEKFKEKQMRKSSTQSSSHIPKKNKVREEFSEKGKVNMLNAKCNLPTPISKDQSLTVRNNQPQPYVLQNSTSKLIASQNVVSDVLPENNLIVQTIATQALTTGSSMAVPEKASSEKSLLTHTTSARTTIVHTIPVQPSAKAAPAHDIPTKLLPAKSLPSQTQHAQTLPVPTLPIHTLPTHDFVKPSPMQTLHTSTLPTKTLQEPTLTVNVPTSAEESMKKLGVIRVV